MDTTEPDPAAVMPVRIGMVNLQRQHAALAGELREAVGGVLASGRFVDGTDNEALEAEIAQYLGVRHAIGLASGTDAVHLALRAVGIGPGCEVITSPFTFVATASAICHAGATPVFADIDPASFNLDPQSVGKAVTPKTRAVLPVHVFGQPAEMPALMALADRHGLAVVEDCAQSFGATLDGIATGAFGSAGAFSFYPTKNLGACGDGGLAVTNSDEVASRLRRLARHGAGGPHEYVEVGFNSRLDAFQAAVLRVKLRHVGDWNRRRRDIAARYTELLAGREIQPPPELPGRMHVYHQYAVLVERRDAVAAELRRAGIATAAHYPRPLHHQPLFAGKGTPVPLPVAEEVSRRCLCLPIYPELEDGEVEEVATALCRIVGK